MSLVVITRRGTRLTRYRDFVGKMVGGDLYLHRRYANAVIPAPHGHTVLHTYAMSIAEGVREKYEPDFQYNCIRYFSRNSRDYIRFDEAPDFDTAREPHVGNTMTIELRYGTYVMKSYQSIWHHKWMWVMDDYPGFDVRESFEWSKYWASRLPEIAKATDETFRAQLRKHKIRY